MEHGVRLTLAYDGSEFAGFQRQPDTRTIQSVLEQAIGRIAQHPVVIRGAARTDAGVHAEGQIVAFTTSRELPPQRWLLAVNRYLPPQIAVQDVAPCDATYNPRYDALDKTYRYLFYLGFGRHPLLRDRAWHLARDAARGRVPGLHPGEIGARLDLDAMRRAGELFVGLRDFRAFRAADDVREQTMRTLHSLELVSDFGGQARLLALEIRGSAFMKNMVRIIAGTLVAVGRGQLSHEQVQALFLPTATRHLRSETAPARGLTLVKITLGRLLAQEYRRA
jgi:tRNA pseudouridine38-40 synthase